MGISREAGKCDYAKTLKKHYPDFIPTQALYLDFEGGGKETNVFSVHFGRSSADPSVSD